MREIPMKLLKFVLISLALALFAYTASLAIFKAVAEQQEYDQRQMVIKCQEGWQYYCRQLVKDHVVIGGNHE